MLRFKGLGLRVSCGGFRAGCQGSFPKLRGPLRSVDYGSYTPLLKQNVFPYSVPKALSPKPYMCINVK